MDLYGGVYVMPQSANQQRNNAYYYNADGSTSPALPNPAPSVAACQAWGAANGLNVVGLEYGGECYGCAGCNYAVDGKVVANCTVDLGCSYNLQIYTLSAVVASPPPPPPSPSLPPSPSPPSSPPPSPPPPSNSPPKPSPPPSPSSASPPPPSPSLAPAWTYQGNFVDLYGGVYVMPQSANQQRNNAYYYNANGSTSPALPNPAPSVAACQAWGAANDLNVVGLEYGGECYGCAGCNYAKNGAVSPNCNVTLGCAYNLQIYTLASPQTRGLALGDSYSATAPASTAASSPASPASTPVSPAAPRSLWITLAAVGAAAVAAATAIGARVFSRRRAARAAGNAVGEGSKSGEAAPTKIPLTQVPSRVPGADV